MPQHIDERLIEVLSGGFLFQALCPWAFRQPAVHVPVGTTAQWHLSTDVFEIVEGRKEFQNIGYFRRSQATGISHFERFYWGSRQLTLSLVLALREQC